MKHPCLYFNAVAVDIRHCADGSHTPAHWYFNVPTIAPFDCGNPTSNDLRESSYAGSFEQWFQAKLSIVALGKCCERGVKCWRSGQSPCSGICQTRRIFLSLPIVLVLYIQVQAGPKWIYPEQLHPFAAHADILYDYVGTAHFVNSNHFTATYTLGDNNYMYRYDGMKQGKAIHTNAQPFNQMMDKAFNSNHPPHAIIYHLHGGIETQQKIMHILHEAASEALNINLQVAETGGIQFTVPSAHMHLPEELKWLDQPKELPYCEFTQDFLDCTCGDYDITLPLLWCGNCNKHACHAACQSPSLHTTSFTCHSCKPAVGHKPGTAVLKPSDKGPKPTLKKKHVTFATDVEKPGKSDGKKKCNNTVLTNLGYPQPPAATKLNCRCGDKGLVSESNPAKGPLKVCDKCKAACHIACQYCGMAELVSKFLCSNCAGYVSVSGKHNRNRSVLQS